jgi:hypothetical protein
VASLIQTKVQLDRGQGLERNRGVGEAFKESPPRLAEVQALQKLESQSQSSSIMLDKMVGRKVQEYGFG